MKKYLITGSSGFLGSRLTSYLEQKGVEITKLNSRNCDLRIKENIYKFNQEYDFIIHLAAWTQAGDFCLKHPGDQWIINQEINTNILSWWKNKQKNAKLVFMGTSCVYAEDSKLLEEEYMLGEPTESLYTYAMTKRMLYQGARALNKQYHLDYLCAVPSTLYGPGYHTDGRQMHFIFDLIRKIIRGKEYGEEVLLWGDGNQKRELVFVDDFVEILYFLMHNSKNEIFNIGAGEEFTIKYFAELICREINFPFDKIKFDESRYVGAKSKFLSTKKLKEVYKNHKMKSLSDGLRETIDWFYKNKAYKL